MNKNFKKNFSHKLHQICTGALHSPKIIVTSMLCVLEIDIPDVLPNVHVMLGAAHKECFECWIGRNVVEKTHTFESSGIPDLSLVIVSIIVLQNI